MCWIVDELAMETLDGFGRAAPHGGTGARDFVASGFVLLLLWQHLILLLCLASTSFCLFSLGRLTPDLPGILACFFTQVSAIRIILLENLVFL
jgi:hypothetical protein